MNMRSQGRTPRPRRERSRRQFPRPSARWLRCADYPQGLFQAMLQQCLEKHPRAGFCPSDIRELDPFYVAAQYGSIESLRVLLVRYFANIYSPESGMMHSKNADMRCWL
ncbi:hypothetical protein BDV23DRAFT_153014 [Aspergillus alliaceus]|uniref:Ankyrin repeat-containing domain protein n=1 Tax=Petromyces alliaceus TaxID=209559 RepID=A0A5N7CBT7_PETAA|nr:hypothetical protein BDV23DRAFT_153014 [Aspergillus alliaceus]